MIDFNTDILPLIHKHSGAEALHDDEARFLYDFLMMVPNYSSVLEIGCELGRSSVLFNRVSKEHDLNLLHIDKWVSGSFYAAKWVEAVVDVGHPFTLFSRDSGRGDLGVILPILAFLYVDGDHEEDGVTADCRRYLPLVQRGGYAAFHDYGRDSLPYVKPVVDKFMIEDVWSFAGHVRTMAIWRRL